MSGETFRLELTVMIGPTEDRTMRGGKTMIRDLVVAGIVGVAAACSGTATGPAGSALDDTLASGGSGDGAGNTVGSGVLRLRCEKRVGRSKLSVDGNDMTPRNGVFSARVTSGGVTVASRAQTAIGDEVEFDFDSEPDDIRDGATAISPGFIVLQPGDDVHAEIVNAQGSVVVSGGAECSAN